MQNKRLNRLVNAVVLKLYHFNGNISELRKAKYCRHKVFIRKFLKFSLFLNIKVLILRSGIVMICTTVVFFVMKAHILTVKFNKLNLSNFLSCLFFC